MPTILPIVVARAGSPRSPSAAPAIEREWEALIMVQHTVFYSWQSDLPNNTNRTFIQTALEHAAQAIRSDESVDVEPVIDRDTDGVPGSPDISSTILAKIDRAAVFVCD